MKKRLAVILTAFMAVSIMAGCGAEKSSYLKDINTSKYVTLNSDYIGLSLNLSPKMEVTEELVNEIALQTYNSRVTSELGAVKDRAVVNGDKINLDYSGAKDGVIFDGGTATNQVLEIGSNSFIPGFESGLVGVMPGETVDLNLTFPEEYKNNPDLAGQEVVFTVTVNFIFPATVDEMKDELISELTAGEYTSLKDYMTSCEEYINESINYNYDVEKENSVITELEKIVIYKKLPQTLLDKYEASLTDSLTIAAQNNGMDIDSLCNYYYKKDSKTYIKEQAEISAKQGLMFQHIANQENLNVSDEELEQSLIELAEENQAESVEALVGDIDKEEFREYFMFQKVLDFIMEKAQITDTAEQE